MNSFNEDGAIVYCEGAFNTPNGKTAHGLVRFTERYKILSVIDSNYSGKDAGMVLDGVARDIPIVDNFEAAFEQAKSAKYVCTHFVIGLAPDGGKLDKQARKTIQKAITVGLNIDSGLHDFISDIDELSGLASKHNVVFRDIRKPPLRKDLHFFSGKIEKVKSYKIAMLGTDSAVGKRTTAWLLVNALKEEGLKVEMIGTGQTAWMQGARYSIVLDSLINDFVSGEIEHAVWQAWNDSKPDVIVIEGQGSLMNPAYPGGFEIMAAGRPDAIMLQHAPARVDYDGFPGYKIHPLPQQIQAVEMISGKPVIAVTINHENLGQDGTADYLQAIQRTIGLPVVDALAGGATRLAKIVISKMNRK